MLQSQPFVICWRGDTTGGKLYDIGDLVTNVVFYPIDIRYELRDTLLIDSSFAKSLEYGRTTEQLKSLSDSVSLWFSEQQMSSFLATIGLKLRMMTYDSLTLALNMKLLQWANHKYPPQVIRSGFHSFINEGPNAGGYSGAWFTYRGVQNLQFFTRKINQANVRSILSSVDTSLSFPQLRDTMLPIAEIEFHDTYWGPE